MASEDDSSVPLYQPLDPSKNQVRLMRVRHNENVDITSELATFSLNDQPEYVALSYAWTKEAPTRKITLNGHEFAVRPNLYAYLELMKRELHDNWIFIDAICVNQDDVVEKGSQVNKMGDIYRNAAEVVSWLGNEVPPETKLVDETIWEEWRTICETGKGIDEIFSDSYDPQRKDGMVKLFIYLFCKPSYWSRLWIVQEVVLSKRLSVRVLDLRLQQESFVSFTRQAEADQFPDHPQQSYMRDIFHQTFTLARDAFVDDFFTFDEHLPLVSKTLDQREKICQGLPYLSILDAIALFSSHSCTLAHDKVYGLFGLTGNEFAADYDMPLFELYMNVLIGCTIQYVKLYDGLEIVGNDGRPSMWSIRLTLLRSFNIRPSHPAIALITQEAFRACGLQDWEKADEVNSIAFDMMSRHYSNWPRLGEYTRLWQVFAWMRLKFIKARLRYYRHRSTSTLPACADSPDLSYDAWRNAVGEIYRIRMAHAKDAESRTL